MASRPRGLLQPIALVLLVPGITLLLWCVRDFLVTGKGTLAPWDPPRLLVSSGSYRFSRNPMYVGVSLILLGWSMAFESWNLLVYALIVTTAFHLRVVFGEEPWLARTHGRKWDDYVTKVPRWLFPSRKALLLSWVGVFVLLLIAGLTYEAYADAQAAREFPPTGTMVDIGGRRLHLVCIGRDDAMDPTVIFESSGWGNALSSSKARERLATRTRVCSYDRLGHGWSDAAPGVTTIGGTASDLGVLQDRAKLAGPFVLVASSIGGLTAEMFARTYPERVAGIVFVDAANSLFVPRLASYSWRITALAMHGRCAVAVRRDSPDGSVQPRRGLGGRPAIGRGHLRRASMDGHLRDDARTEHHAARVRAGATAVARVAARRAVRVELAAADAVVRGVVHRPGRDSSRDRRSASSLRKEPRRQLEEDPRQLTPDCRQSAGRGR